MEPFRFHVYACDQKKPDGQPCCSARGSVAVIDALRRELGMRGLADTVQVTTCGSLGLCERGPNLVVYPEGLWYSGVQAADVPEIVAEHFVAGRPVERLVNHDATAVKQEITGNRNKMLAGMKARDAAGVVPDEIGDLVRGYQASRILLTALELDVFSAVAKHEPADAAQVAGDAGADSRATAMLLDALVALGVLAKPAGRYANTPAGRRFLAAGSPDDARLALRHNSSLWKTWSHLTETVRTGHPPARPEMKDRAADDWTVPFISAMHRNAAFRAPIVVNAVGAGEIGRLIDIGGGSGAYSLAFAKANPALQAEVFDLPTVLPIAQRHIDEAGLADRVHTREGDLRRDAFGQGWDAALVSAICHMLSPDENRDLLRRVFAALAPGGRIVIQDHIMGEDRTTPRAGALFAINMLSGLGKGGTYTEAEYAAWLREAGFAEVKRVALTGPNDLMIGRRAARD